MRGLGVRAVALAALGELIPLYGVYALLFADFGLSGGEISTLFVIWAATSLIVGVPAGVWADRVPRHRLLALSTMAKAAGFGLWIVAPGYPAFAAGFVLWGLASAINSGAFEALVYDELVALGAAQRYPAVRGRITAAQLLGEVGGTALAAPLLLVGGYQLIGAVSVAACLAEAVVALSLPARKPPGASGGSYLATLRAGLAEVAGHRSLRWAVLLVAALTALTAIDEYVPLLLRDAGMSAAVVPLWTAVLPLAAAAGAAAAGWRRLAGRVPMVVALLLGAAVLAASAPAGAVSAMPGLICWYAVVHLAGVLADTRLQDAVTGTARATVTSVAEFGSDVAAIALFVGYGLGTDTVSPAVLLTVGVAAPTVLVAAAAARRMSGSRPDKAPTPEEHAR